MSFCQLIEKSTEQYAAMLDHLASMIDILKTADPQAITSALEQWNLLQQETRQIDVRIDQELTGEKQEGLSLILKRRTELMTQVAYQCKQVQARTNLLKAMVSDELSRLHQGRKALGGYKGEGSHKGHKLTASF